MDNKNEHKYTDKELKDATQVAYLKFLETTIQNCIIDGEKEPLTIGELLAKNVRLKKDEKIIKLDWKSLIEYADIQENDKEILRGLPDEVFNWKIVDIHDKNYVNGFYGCVIETSPENAIVAFRGSEGLKDYPGAIHDWVKADFGLFQREKHSPDCTPKTEQHEECERYAEALISHDILEKYQNISVTGHSLGGHIASHFAVITAFDGIRNHIFNKINQVVNFDGPGVSKEYIKYYEEQIKKASKKITHLQWSLVGGALNSLPGENTKTLKVNEELYKDNPVVGKFLRHSTESISFDESGNAIEGDKDFLSEFTHKVSVFAEYVPGDLIVDYVVPNNIQKILGLAASTIKKSIYQKEDGQIGFDPFGIRDDELKYKDTILCGMISNMIYKAALNGNEKDMKELNNVISFEDLLKMYSKQKDGYSDVENAVKKDENFRRRINS